jgi:hypothetical protein
MRAGVSRGKGDAPIADNPLLLVGKYARPAVDDPAYGLDGDSEKFR